VPPDETLTRESPTAEPEREREPERKPVEPPQSKPAPSVAASAANNVGRGRMSGDANYQGRVAAHLARYKRFPAEARKRRETGSAVVSFNIDGTGKVTSVKLVRGTGYPPLDREVEEMVHRASPFPPPPGGSARSFTAPVSFNLN
jgi:protein TonB